MVKKKVKKPVKKVVKTVIKKVVEKIVKKVKKEDSGISIKQWEKAVAEIKSDLMSHSTMKRGGRIVRSKHIKEQAKWTPVIAELNTIGKRLGCNTISFGNLRKP